MSDDYNEDMRRINIAYQEGLKDGRQETLKEVNNIINKRIEYLEENINKLKYKKHTNEMANKLDELKNKSGFEVKELLEANK